GPGRRSRGWTAAGRLPRRPAGGLREPTYRAPGLRVPGSVPAVAMTGHDPQKDIAENYREFARLEARGRSPGYESLAEAVADDPALLRFLSSLPPDKRQPNLLFAAARYLLGAPAQIAQLRGLASQASAELAEH